MEEAPRDRHGAWDRWKPRLLCFGLGVALGTFGIQVILRSFPSSAPPLTKNPSSGRDRAPVKPPARTGKKPPVAAKPPDPVPEPVRREAGALFFQHEEKLRLRLPEPRPGTPPHHIGKTFHATLKSASHVVRPTGLESRPFEAEALFSILWYCDGKMVEPQTIWARYYYEYGAWKLTGLSGAPPPTPSGVRGLGPQAFSTFPQHRLRATCRDSCSTGLRISAQFTRIRSSRRCSPGPGNGRAAGLLPVRQGRKPEMARNGKILRASSLLIVDARRRSMSHTTALFDRATPPEMDRDAAAATRNIRGRRLHLAHLRNLLRALPSAGGSVSSGHLIAITEGPWSPLVVYPLPISNRGLGAVRLLSPAWKAANRCAMLPDLGRRREAFPTTTGSVP